MEKCRLFAKEGAIAFAALILAEILLLGVQAPLSMLIGLESGDLLISVVTILKVLAVLGAYVFSVAVFMMFWMPLPKWSFWLLACPWGLRLFGQVFFMAELTQAWLFWRQQGPYANDMYLRVMPFLVAIFILMATGLMAFEFFFNKMQMKRERS